MTGVELFLVLCLACIVVSLIALAVMAGIALNRRGLL